MGSAFRKRGRRGRIEGLRMVGGSERATPAGVYSILPAATFEAYAMTLAKAGKSSSSKYGGILRSYAKRSTSSVFGRSNVGEPKKYECEFCNPPAEDDGLDRTCCELECEAA